MSRIERKYCLIDQSRYFKIQPNTIIDLSARLWPGINHTNSEVYILDCWQSVFLSKFSRGYYVSFNSKGNEPPTYRP